MNNSRWDTRLKVVMLMTALLTADALFAAGPNAGDSDSDSDERIVVPKAIRLKDCPEVKVLGSGHARMLSVSSRTFLGVETSDLTPELREHFGAPSELGVMLSKVIGDSAAEAAGLSVGDVVTRVDGDEISSTSELGRAVRRKEGGDIAEIEYWRDGEMYHATAMLEEQERCSVDIGDTLRSIRIEDLPAIGELGIEIGGEALESTLEALRPVLAGEGWAEHFEGLEGVDFEHIEERMERVQERLERLEERMEREYGREFERAERELERAKERALHERERAERERSRAVERVEREHKREREQAERAKELAERELKRAEGDQDDGEGEPI